MFKSALVLAVLCIASHAEAQPRAWDWTASVSYGQSFARTDHDGETGRPFLRTELTRRFLGPLAGGLYMVGVGEDGVLSHPSFGGGTVLRFNLRLGRFPLVPFAEGSIGRLRLRTNDGIDKLWDAQLGGGLGLRFRRAGFEVIARHQWFLDRDTNEPASRNVSVSGALVFHMD